MTLSSLHRSDTVLEPDRSRVLIRPHGIGSRERQIRIIARLLDLSDSQVERELQELLSRFKGRHPDLRGTLLTRFDSIAELFPTDRPVTESHKMLIGAAFILEYSLEGAALFNPSIVAHPDQSGLEPGALRFIMSLRATGEGHISSLVFREGEVSCEGDISIYTPTRYVTEGVAANDPVFDTALFRDKLKEIGDWNDTTRRILKEVGTQFTLRELQSVLYNTERSNRNMSSAEQGTIARVRTLLRSHYAVNFPENRDLSERVIYPIAPTERLGIEDARFVLFQNDDDSETYHAIYTAFDGNMILPQLLSTKDFTSFHISTLSGLEVENKGMALFPRKLGGQFAAVGRQDNENLYLMYSDRLLFWRSKQLLLRPTFPWECVQIGNCGSPIETEAGWLLLTHGVGPMRTYSIGAVLLDSKDPARVIGRLPSPLLMPTESEREGYVPNVLYSCGALVHCDRLILPYAVSDSSNRFATVKMDELLEELIRCGPTGSGTQGER